MVNEKRLIYANALMEAFRSYMAERYDKEKCVSEENCKDCEKGCLWRKVVSAAPTVDAVEVVYGRWIPIANYVVCSRCGFEINRGEQNRTAFLIENRYCRYCGTNMDGEKDEKTN